MHLTDEATQSFGCLSLCCCLLQVDVRVVSTEHAKHFYDTTEVPVRVYGDQDEWQVIHNEVINSDKHMILK